MHIVSSAYVTSSKSAPGTLCLCNVSSMMWWTSWNSVVITIRNTYGDSGHPCLIPVFCGSQSEVYPSISTQKSVSLYSDLVMFINFWSTPILSIELNSCFLSTLSNAFSQSRSTRCRWFCVLSPNSIILLIRCIASPVDLSFLNPNCVFV